MFTDMSWHDFVTSHYITIWGIIVKKIVYIRQYIDYLKFLFPNVGISPKKIEYQDHE